MLLSLCVIALEFLTEACWRTFYGSHFRGILRSALGKTRRVGQSVAVEQKWGLEQSLGVIFIGSPSDLLLQARPCS